MKNKLLQKLWFYIKSSKDLLMVTLIVFLLQSKLLLQKIYHKRNIKNIPQKKHIPENPITNKDKC